MIDSAVAALLGAAIGVAGPFIGGIVQQGQQTKRERFKIATDLALADYALMVQRVQTQGGFLPPMASFVTYHKDMLDALWADKFDPARIKAIEERQTLLMTAFPKRFCAGEPGTAT